MDRVSRLIRACLVLLLAAAGGGAHAYGSVPMESGYCWVVNTDPFVTCGMGASAALSEWAQKATAAGQAGTTKYSYAVSSVEMQGVDRALGNIKVTISNQGETQTSTRWVEAFRGQPTKACPGGSIPDASNTNCECPLGMKPSTTGSGCMPYDCPSKGSYTQQVSPDVKLPNAGDSFCQGGCKFTPSQWKVDQEGQTWGVWPMKSANQACGGKPAQGTGIPSGEDSPEPAPVACGTGQCPGSINGTSVCVPCKSQSTQGPSSTQEGSQPGQSSDPSNPDKTVTGSQETTTCVGAICTTKTEYLNSKGEVVGSKTDEQSEENYCQKNPSSKQCKKDSFGGACEGGFQCEGDAVQCALAKEVHQRNCQWFKDPPLAMRDAGEKALAGGVQPDWHPYKQAGGGTPFSLSSVLDRSDALGGGGCPADTVFGVMGQTLTISWSQFCGSLAMLGNIAVALTALACAFIVFRE